MGVAMFNMQYRAWRSPEEVENGILRLQVGTMWLDSDDYARRITRLALQEMARRSYTVEVNNLLYSTKPGDSIQVKGVRGEYGELLPPRYIIHEGPTTGSYKEGSK